MFDVPILTDRALADPAAVLGYFVSLGVVQMDDTVAWKRYSSQPMAVTFGTEAFPAGAAVIDTSLPDRRTLNLGGGDGGYILISDPTRTIFERFAVLTPPDTRAQISVALFHAGAWTPPLRLFTGHVEGAKWVAQDKQSYIDVAGIETASRPKLVIATDTAQQERASGDRSLDQIGRQTYLEWTSSE